ncbi:MAG: hypothetical protein ACYC38_07545 [Eubacteriales bacterium]
MNMRKWYSAFCMGLLILGLAGCGGAGKKPAAQVSLSSPAGAVTRPVATTPARVAASPYKVAQPTPRRDPFVPLVVASAAAPGGAARLARSSVPTSGGGSTQQPADPKLLTVYAENGVKRASIMNDGKLYEMAEGESFDGYKVLRIDSAGTVTLVKDGRALVLNMVPPVK